MSQQPIEIPIKLNGLAQIKAELRQLKGEIANATDPTQMAELADSAGELSDRLKDANEKIAVFASGSKLEQSSNAFGLMSSQLASMDFEGAAESAKLFSKTLTSITPKEIGTQIKGLVSTVGTLGKAFMTFGLQLLANPIFLLIAVITAIVAAVVWFAYKMGWLGKIFDAVKKALQPLIDAIKWFLDLIGLTNFAQEERNAKAIKGLKEEHAAMMAVGHQIDNKIALLEAEGKSTIALRQEKNKLYLEEAKANAEGLKVVASMVDSNSVMGQSFTNLQLGAEDAVNKLTADEKKLTNELKAENKKRADDFKAYQKERLDAQRFIQDLMLAQMQDGTIKEAELNKVKYQRLIEDTKVNEKLKAEEKAKIIALYEEQQRIENLKIYQKEADEMQAAINLANENKKNAKIKAEEDEKARLAEQHALSLETLGTEQEQELAKIKADYEAKRLIAEDNAVLMNALNKKEKDEIAETNKKYRLEEIAKEQALRDAKISIVSDTVNGLGELGKLFINDQKKLEKINKAMALVQIGIDTAKAISALVASSQANPLNATSFGAAGIAQFASGIVQIVTNIAKAKALLSSPGSSPSSGGGGGGASSNSAQAVTPQFNMFGSAGNQNTVNASGQPNNQNITVTAVVSETEITSTQNKINKMQLSASL